MSKRSPVRGLAAAQLANSLGDGAYYVTSALYFTGVVGLSPTRIGLALTVAWAIGAVAGVPLGALADRRGPRGVSVGLALATAAAVLSFLVIRSYPAFLLAAVAYAVAQCGLAAARQALLAGLVGPGERTAVLARLQSVLNAGLAVGAGIGGLALQHDTTGGYLAVFAFDGAGFVICAALLAGLPKAAPVAVPEVREARFAVMRDRPYAVVTLLNAVLLLRMPLLSLAVPLWIVSRTDAPGWLVSALFVLNTLGVTAFQVRAARGIDGAGAATRGLRRAGAMLALSCVVFAVSAQDRLGVWGASAVLVLASVFLLVGEMGQSAGSWQLAFSLAPAHQVGQYQGFFGTGVPLARTVGPLVLTALLVTWGVPGWLLLGAVFLAAGAAFGPATRWARRTRGLTEARPAAAAR
ncbi:MFS transporter [Streptomyces xanthii]|uniref:MFS transporter n=1 Tax=Streptomyces xanthii TaxID=2768069 RepID=A0A7H1B7R4_9ACTN|nr:MFS transporter [Streptomyces xanthii]QNS04769.1 MFS transporter [Streptomyces xanthii]